MRSSFLRVGGGVAAPRSAVAPPGVAPIPMGYNSCQEVSSTGVPLTVPAESGCGCGACWRQENKDAGNGGAGADSGQAPTPPRGARFIRRKRPRGLPPESPIADGVGDLPKMRQHCRPP